MGGRWEQQIFFFTAATRRLPNKDAECALYVYPGCYKSRAFHAPAHSPKDLAGPCPSAWQLTLFNAVKHHLTDLHCEESGRTLSIYDEISVEVVPGPRGKTLQALVNGHQFGSASAS